MGEFINWFNTILFWLGFYILLWNAYILLFNRGVPNIRTAPAIRKKIIERLKADAAVKGKVPYVVIDMGSGNGLFTRQIARAMPEAKVIGLEISTLAYQWSLAFQRLCGIKNLEYKKADFFAYDMAEADAVLVFLTIYDMGRVGKKLNENLRPGTLVTCNKFQLGDGWTPQETIDVSTLYPHQKTLNVYRKA
jgi:SAM-dependent methyltransferase